MAFSYVGLFRVFRTYISNLASTEAGLGASTVGVEDSAGSFTGTDVEAVLAELYTAATSAQSDSFTDTNTFYATDTVGAAFDALGVAIGGTNSTTRNYSSNLYIADNDDIVTALEKLDAGLADGALAAAPAAIELVGGVLTVTGPNIIADVEGGVAATDDLDTITGLDDGQMLVLRISNAARNIVVKSGVDNIVTPYDFDVTLDGTTDVAVFRRLGATVYLLSFRLSAEGGGGLGLALASGSNGFGASLVGLEDAATLFAVDNVEAALAEVMTDVDALELLVDQDVTNGASPSFATVTASVAVLLQDAAALQLGTAGGDLVLTADGTDGVLTGTGDLVVGDNVDFAFGAGKDISIVSGGTDVTVSGTGDLVFADSLDVAFGAGKDVIFTSDGTDLAVTGTGDINLGVDLTLNDGFTLGLKGKANVTGQVVEFLGDDSGEGWTRVVYDEVVSPVAVETNLINLPAGSVIESVQARCTVILVAGGTTVTWSVGTAADPDHYGSAGYSDITGAAAADSLAANSNINWFGDSAHAVSMSTATEQFVLTGAATGGAADGNTAFSSGSVRVRVVYRRLQPLTPV